MGRKAKPLQAQIELLRKRGMIIENAERARNLLIEIGFYRMSFYWFPFETRYPDRLDPHHEFLPGTTFNDALMLYAFDFNLRNALLKPLERIETSFRTFLIYAVSTTYPDSPCWFTDRHIVGDAQAKNFERTIYMPLKRNNVEILLHHRRFPHDKFAPAWKTIEFMTLGSVCNIYSSLTNHNLKHTIATHFGVFQESVFENYLEIIKSLRNICAHGNVLYSYRPQSIRRNNRDHDNTQNNPSNLRGALNIIEDFLEVISPRLHKEFRRELNAIVKEFSTSPGTLQVLKKISGLHPRSDHPQFSRRSPRRK